MPRLDPPRAESAKSEREETEVDVVRPCVVGVGAKKQNVDPEKQNVAVVLRPPVHPLRVAAQPPQVPDWGARTPCHVQLRVQ